MAKIRMTAFVTHISRAKSAVMTIAPRTLLALMAVMTAASLQRVAAAVTLPSIFSDHMVLQSGTDVPVWGWALPGEVVTLSINGQTATAKAGTDGKWEASLGKIRTGGPYTLEVKGTNALTVSDVLAGEVWLGSGQSNMGFPMEHLADFAQEKPLANFPQVRMFLVANPGVKPDAQEDLKGRWLVTTPDNIAKFSAVLYLFGRELHQTLGEPVGLIKAAVGGTPIELWIDAGAQKSSPELKGFFEAKAKEDAAFNAGVEMAKYNQFISHRNAAAGPGGTPGPAPLDPVARQKRNSAIGGLFNSNIAPLIPYAIRGMIWDQGESNTAPWEAPFYQYQLPLLITDWRARWGNNFPVAWVQIANVDVKNQDWPGVREAMLKTLKLPDTGMAVTTDIGDAHNLHYTDKQDVSHRLALWALGTVYGQKTAVSGPLPAGHAKNGSDIVLFFTHTDGGLTTKNGALRGFVIAGADKQWVPGVARIDGDHVIVSSPSVKDPAAVRYAWENNPDGNLYNGAGLPASPFRTDDAQ